MTAPTPIDPERGQWTSASAAEADRLCPGRHLAQQGLPEDSNKYTEIGTRVHAFLAGETIELSADEMDSAQECQGIEQNVVMQWLSGVPQGDLKCYREKRMWIDFGELKHSGKPDAVYVRGCAALIIDYKPGHKEVPDSPKNLQLRDLAVLACRTYGVQEVTVAIIQPWATHKPELCTYTLPDLVTALTEMEERVKASNQPDAPRIPGKAQCEYCKAKGTCREFAATGLPALAFHHVKKEDAESAMPGAIAMMSPERLGLFLGLVRLAEEVATAEVRKRLEGGEAVQGWQLSPGRKTEKITDPQGVWTRCQSKGVTIEQFMGAVTVTKGGLKDALRAATGAKGKALDAEVKAATEGLTESKESKPVLEAV